MPMMHQTPDPARLAYHTLTASMVTILQVISGLDVALFQVRELVLALLVRILGSVLEHHIIKMDEENV